MRLRRPARIAPLRLLRAERPGVRDGRAALYPRTPRQGRAGNVPDGPPVRETPNAPIVGFCEFGYDPAAPESSGYAISFIATALSERGRHLGAILLDCALRWMANDAARHGRTPYVLTQIDPRNEASVHLFSGAGFENEGRDENDPEFDIWSKEFEPLATDRLYFYSPIMIDEDDKN